MVGFQTNMTWPEQRRVFAPDPRPGAGRVRALGPDAPQHLHQLARSAATHAAAAARRRCFFAGQITGTEGYVGSTVGGPGWPSTPTGWCRGWRRSLPATTMMGALFAYITHADPSYFQPMKANFGLMPALEETVRNKGDRYLAYADRSPHALAQFMALHDLSPITPASPSV